MEVNPSTTFQIGFGEREKAAHIRGAVGMLETIADYIEREALTPLSAYL